MNETKGERVMTEEMTEAQERELEEMTADNIQLWTPTDALPEMQKLIGFAVWKLKQMAEPDTLAAMVRIQEALQAAIDKEGLPF